MMLTLDEIKQALEDRKLVMVAKATGLHYNTIRAYALGEIQNPSHNAMVKLSEYLSK